MGHSHSGNMKFLGGSDETGGISTTDIKLAKSISMNGVGGKLALVVQDINGTYFDMYAATPRTRTMYINAELTF